MDKSEGAYLSSVDDDPLVIVDAASQIASLGLGYQAAPFKNALDTGEFNYALLSNFNILKNTNDTLFEQIKCMNKGFKHFQKRNFFPPDDDD